MLVPVIRIRDKYSGCERIVGTDHHDKLVITSDGQLHYTNWQCCDGTGGEGYGYEFVGKDIPIDEYSCETHMEFMKLDDFIKLAKEIEAEEIENDKRLRERLGLSADAIIIS